MGLTPMHLADSAQPIGSLAFGDRHVAVLSRYPCYCCVRVSSL
jgi:hypothetical protein